jgi:hypothetical protein
VARKEEHDPASLNRGDRNRLLKSRVEQVKQCDQRMARAQHRLGHRALVASLRDRPCTMMGGSRSVEGNAHGGIHADQTSRLT